MRARRKKKAFIWESQHGDLTLGIPVMKAAWLPLVLTVTLVSWGALGIPLPGASAPVSVHFGDKHFRKHVWDSPSPLDSMISP